MSESGAAPLGGTPGPWSLWGPDYTNPGEEAWHITAEETVAFAYSEPDARLIAAAPELLKALELLLRPKGYESPVAYEAACAAIAKARGEQ